MKNKLGFTDILDLTHLIAMDVREEDSDSWLHKRDREIYLNNSSHKQELPHDKCIHLWLGSRKKELATKNESLPGEKIDEAKGLFQILLGIIGFITGCALSLSYLAYTGKTPLNVFLFFTLFLIPQVILLLVLVGRSFLMKLGIAGYSKYGRLLRSLLSSLFKKIHGNWLTTFNIEEQKKIFSLLGKERPQLLFWPIFRMSQLLGIGINLGILLVFILKISTTDLAFGWQTTLSIGAEKLFTLVDALALPWSPLLQEMSHPSLEEIEGSRIILKESIAHLQTSNLTSWWPFLAMSLITYGLIPRILLYFYGAVRERLYLNASLKSSKFRQITNRMQTPIVTSQAPPQIVDEKPKVQPSPVVQQQETKVIIKPPLLLVPDDIFEELADEDLTKLLNRFGYAKWEKIKVFYDFDNDGELLATLEKIKTERDILLLLEAWMVPIQEQLDFFSHIQTVLPERCKTSIIFLGKPKGDDFCTEPAVSDLNIWSGKLQENGHRIEILNSDEK